MLRRVQTLNDRRGVPRFAEATRYGPSGWALPLGWHIEPLSHPPKFRLRPEAEARGRGRLSPMTRAVSAALTTSSLYTTSLQEHFAAAYKHL